MLKGKREIKKTPSKADGNLDERFVLLNDIETLKKEKKKQKDEYEQKVSNLNEKVNNLQT